MFKFYTFYFFVCIACRFVSTLLHISNYFLLFSPSISVHSFKCHKSEPNNDGSKNQGFFKGKFVELSSLNTDTTTYTCRLLHGLLDRFGSSSLLNILGSAVIPLNFPIAHRVRFFGAGKTDREQFRMHFLEERPNRQPVNKSASI